MKRKWKVGLTVLGVLLMLSAISHSYASENAREVAAHTAPSVTIYMNGKLFTPYDTEAGESMEVLIYNNRTYLPVRAIGEAMDLHVAWEKDSKAVRIDNR